MTIFKDNEEREEVLKKIYKIMDTFGIENKFSNRQSMIEAFQEGRNYNK